MPTLDDLIQYFQAPTTFEGLRQGGCEVFVFPETKAGSVTYIPAGFLVSEHVTGGILVYGMRKTLAVQSLAQVMCTL